MIFFASLTDPPFESHAVSLAWLPRQEPFRLKNCQSYMPGGRSPWSPAVKIGIRGYPSWNETRQWKNNEPGLKMNFPIENGDFPDFPASYVSLPEGICWKTSRKTNIAPGKWWLEDCFPFGKVYIFSGVMFNFRWVIVGKVSPAKLLHVWLLA